MENYRDLLTNIKGRYNPDRQYGIESKMFSDLASDITDLQRYVYLSMMAVDESYTATTKAAGERVMQHLQNGGLTDVSYHYQGSVMTDTHIKGHSDIDLLTVCEKFYSYDANGTKNILETYRYNYTTSQLSKLQAVANATPYQGDVYSDLRNLRLKSESILLGKYNICNVSHAKAIKITNQDLHRDVDIVTAGWYDDVHSILNDKGIYRGIQVYDKEHNTKCSPDYPFLSIDRINTKSATTNGRLKRMIRFLKNIKVDSKQNIDLSSFDINAICYAIDIVEYNNLYYLQLVEVVWRQLYKIATDSVYAYNLTSVDGKEYIFRGNQKVQEIVKLKNEVFSIYQAIQNLHLL